MHDNVPFVLYLIVIGFGAWHFIRYRDVPLRRRLAVCLGVVGFLSVLTVALYVCEPLASVFIVVLFFMIVLDVLGMIIRSIFR